MFKKMLVTLGILAISACSQAQTATQTDTADQNPSKPLIVYLSRTQNTATLAQMIQKHTGGDMAKIEVQTPYPADYSAQVAQVRRENEQNYLPPLKPLVKDIADYQSVYLGFPIWSMTLPPPVKSWLANTDLSGKIIYPFNTYGQYGIGNSIDEIKRLCRGCVVKPVLSIQGGREKEGVMLAITGTKKDETERQVKNWLDGHSK